MIYLASPYTHDDPAVMQARYEAVCQAAAHFMGMGHHVYSPIAHSHGIAAYGLPTEWKFWQALDEDMIRRCDEVWVVMLDGWDESRGIRAEVAFAQAEGKRVFFMLPESTPHPKPADALTDQSYAAMRSAYALAEQLKTLVETIDRSRDELRRVHQELESVRASKRMLERLQEEHVATTHGAQPPSAVSPHRP